jgi:hypothetical protein
VVVDVTDHNGLFEVSDYSEGMALAMQRLHRRSGVPATVGQRVCASSGLTFTNGRVSTVVPQADLADAVMRVAAAAARIAEAVDFELAKPERTKRDFSQEVEHELVERKVGVERTHTIVGQSGHRHHPTLFVPSAHALVEPIGAEAPWTRATAVYALFGDVLKVNGFSRYAVIDDAANTSRTRSRTCSSRLVAWCTGPTVCRGWSGWQSSSRCADSSARPSGSPRR